MSNIFYVGQTDYIDQFNLLASRVLTAGITFGSLSVVTGTPYGTGSLSYDISGTFTYVPPYVYTKTEIDTSLALKANTASPTFTGIVNGISKSMVGLGNVDNTTDLLKPLSTASIAALALKANLASPTFTGTVSGITKTMVGLDSVDNTTDLLKPLSTASITALALKADNTAVALKAPLSGPTFTGTVSGITKAMVGLGNVDNTADIDKAISTLTAASILTEKTRAMAAEALLAPQSTTYNKTETDARISAIVGAAPAALDTLIEIGNQLAVDENAVAALTTAVSLKASIASPTFTGTVSGITKAMVGLSNVDNTTDILKPVSTATTAAINVVATNLATNIANLTDLTSVVNLKAPLDSPVFTGTVTGITKAMVGLSNVDNTSDLTKPISNLTAASILTEKNRALAAEALLAPQLTTYTKTEVDNKIAGTIAVYSFNNLTDKPTTIAGYGITDAFTGNTYNPINIYSTLASTSPTTGALTVSGGAGIAGSLNLGSISSIKALMETVTINTLTAPTTITYFDVNTQSVLYYPIATTTNFTLYIRGSSTVTLNNSLAIGQSITIALLITNGATAYYPNIISIDGTTITPKWANGLAVSSGTASSIDSYNITCIKTAAATFTVIASRSKFS